jgi:hypothetical protein
MSVLLKQTEDKKLIIDLYKEFYINHNWKNLESIAKYAEAMEMRFKGDNLAGAIVGFRGPVDLADFDAFFKANDISISNKLQDVLGGMKDLGFGIDLTIEKDTNNLNFYFIDCGIYDTSAFEPHIDQELKRDLLRLSFNLDKDRITGAKVYRRIKKSQLNNPDEPLSKLYVFSIDDKNNVELVTQQACKTSSEDINKLEISKSFLECYEAVDQTKYKIKKSFRENTDQFYLRVTDRYK